MNGEGGRGRASAESDHVGAEQASSVTTSDGGTILNPLERRITPMPFGFHWPELLAVGVVAILIFGPKRLPEIGSSIGKTFREFKKSMNEIADVQPHQAAQLPAEGETTVVATSSDGAESSR